MGGLGRRMNSRDATNALLRDRGLRHGMNVNMMAQLKNIPMRPKPLSEDDEKMQKPKFEDDEKLQRSSYRDTSSSTSGSTRSGSRSRGSSSSPSPARKVKPLLLRQSRSK